MKSARLIYGSTAQDAALYNADLRWRIRMVLHDPHFFVEFPGSRRAVLIASALEINRARKEAHGVSIESADELRKETGVGESFGAIAALLGRHRVKTIIIHPDTPVEIAERLRLRFRVWVGGRPWYPARIKKTPEEIRAIRESIRVAEKALGMVKERLGRASVRGGILYESTHPLTSELLRNAVEEWFFKKGFFASGTIISSGASAADPHAIGEKIVAARSPIVCDIFPYSRKSGFYADITRTFFKGMPPPAIEKAYRAVLNAQKKGILLLRAGADGRKVHTAVSRLFEKEGFETVPSKGEGFIHSTGHGVGLECHELIHIGSSRYIIPAGSVVTVEPGLYYPRDGYGIRIEDMVRVGKRGSELLTSFPKNFTSAVIS